MSIVRSVITPTPADLTRAQEVVSRSLAPTPLLPPGPGSNLHLKAESLQPIGSFKVRGGLAAVDAVPADRPVITASAGNHALGVAYAATLLGRRAIVVTAENASVAKMEAIRRFPVEHIQVGTSFDDAEAYALDRAADGATYVSAYNDPHVIAGQATIGRELEQQMTGAYTVVCGVGGGGLAAGLGLWAAQRDDVRIVGVETAASTAVSAAVAAGHQVDVQIGPSIADGMAGNIEPGSLTIELIRDYVDQLLTVTENEIRAAIRYLAIERGIVAEGAGAAAAAAVLTGKVHGPAVAIVSGRNITAHLLGEILRG
ncbi:pyridoxal-phosphate dependent enzyme [Agromyces sp. NPDC049794]|uniref:threonine ammonia-lyase n=1 Tax=unclassified Agromyces TaxID=2639701 RepID=UPI00340EC5D8